MTLDEERERDRTTELVVEFAPGPEPDRNVSEDDAALELELGHDGDVLGRDQAREAVVGRGGDSIGSVDSHWTRRRRGGVNGPAFVVESAESSHLLPSYPFVSASR